MRATPRLLRSVGWTVSGTFVFAISQWAIVALTAKLAGPVALGLFTLAAAVVAPILALAQTQLRGVLGTDARYEHRLGDFLQVGTVLTLTMAVGTPLVAVLVGTDSITVKVITAFVIAKSFDSISDILYGYHQRREDMKVIAIGQFANGTLSVLFFGGMLYLKDDIVLATTGYAVASGITLVAWAIPITVLARKRDTDDPRDQPQARMRLLRLAMPLGVVMVLAGIASNLPRYAVQIDLGEAALGVFGGLAYMVLVGTNFVSAIGQAASPRLAKHAAAGRTADFGRLLKTLLGVSIATAGVGLLVSIIWGRPLVQLIYTSEFTEHTGVLVALAAAALASFPAIILAVAATAARNFRAQLPVFVIVLVVGAVACFYLVPLWGMAGAAAATALMALVQAVGCGLLVRSAVWGRP